MLTRNITNDMILPMTMCNFTKQFPPRALTGELKLIIICKTIIHSQQWAFTFKSSVAQN